MLFALLSSISLTAMVIFDKLMVKDCYGNNVSQALFVSTCAGTFLGLLATAISWLLWPITVLELLNTLWAFLSPYGFLIMLSGAMSALVLKYYFTCFSAEADSTVIASWLAVTPILVYVGMYLLSLLNLVFEPINFSLAMFLAVCGISISLFFLERISYETSEARGNYQKNLFFMLLFNTTYVLLIDQTLAHATANYDVDIDTLVLSLLPMYWFGFASGMSALMFESERKILINNILLIKFLLALIIAEILGMFVFFFEFLSLGNTSSIIVSIIIGLHVIPVWIISKILTRHIQKPEFAQQDTVEVFSLPVSKATFDDVAVRHNNSFQQLFFVLTTILCISAFLLLSMRV